MTEQQLEEKKAEQEVFSRLRAIRRRNQKEQKRLGLEAYNALHQQRFLASLEDYCRAHPGVKIVNAGDDYMLKDIDGTTQP